MREPLSPVTAGRLSQSESGHKTVGNDVSNGGVSGYFSGVNITGFPVPIFGDVAFTQSGSSGGPEV